MLVPSLGCLTPLNHPVWGSLVEQPPLAGCPLVPCEPPHPRPPPSLPLSQLLEAGAM